MFLTPVKATDQNSILVSVYDGSQLCSKWIEGAFGESGSCIGWFLGPAHVTPDGHMIDMEDIRNNDPIHSDAMLHFLVRLVEEPPDLTRVVALQRLLIRLIADKLKRYKRINMLVEGDDIFLQDGEGPINRKLSVSIATLGHNCSLIHVGLNLTQSGAPSTVKVGDLTAFDLLLRYGPPLEQPMWCLLGFANAICDTFAAEYESIQTACNKVLLVDREEVGV